MLTLEELRAELSIIISEKDRRKLQKFYTAEIINR